VSRRDDNSNEVGEVIQEADTEIPEKSNKNNREMTEKILELSSYRRSIYHRVPKIIQEA